MGYWTYDGMTSNDELTITRHLFEKGDLYEDFIDYFKDRYGRDDLIDEIVDRNGDMKTWFEDLEDEFVMDWAESHFVEGEDVDGEIIWHDGEPPE